MHPCHIRGKTEVPTATASDSPFLHYQLLSGVLRLLNVRLHSGSGEIAGAVGMDRNNIQGVAGQPIWLDRFGQPGLSTGQDKDLQR